MLRFGNEGGGIDQPYRVRYYDDAMDHALWTSLAATFPDDQAMHDLNQMGRKNHFCDRDNNFVDYVRELTAWHDFHRFLLARFEDICAQVLGVPVDGRKAQFEWSSLPGQGGEVRPHPDSCYKVATAVMFFNSYWDDDWGGGFEVLRHKTMPDADWSDKQPPWDEVETLMTIPVRPRRILFMRRTNNSLHGVRPVRAPRSRRTITVNLMGTA